MLEGLLKKEPKKECTCQEMAESDHTIILCCCTCGKKIKYTIPDLQTGYMFTKTPPTATKNITNAYELPPSIKFLLMFKNWATVVINFVISLFYKKHDTPDNGNEGPVSFSGCVYHKACDTYYRFNYRVVNK